MDGLAIVEFEAVAQAEGVGQFVVADLPTVDHLRPRLERVVE